MTKVWKWLEVRERKESIAAAAVDGYLQVEQPVLAKVHALTEPSGL